MKFADGLISHKISILILKVPKDTFLIASIKMAGILRCKSHVKIMSSSFYNIKIKRIGCNMWVQLAFVDCICRSRLIAALGLKVLEVLQLS